MFIEHIGIKVKDAEASAEFYCKNLGFEISGRHINERVKIVFIKSENGVVELVQNLNVYEERTAGIVDHIAFRVYNIDKAIDRIREAGVKFISDKPMDFGKDKIFFFEGPDGEKLEFVETGK